VGWKIAVPLIILCVLAALGGWVSQPLTEVFPAADNHHEAAHMIEYIGIAIPLLGLLIAYLIFLGGQLSVSGITESPAGKALHSFWLDGWRIDKLYNTLLVRPFTGLARLCRNEPVDQVYNSVVGLLRWSHRGLASLQTGELRWYATSMVFGLVVLVAIMLRNAT